MKRIKFVHNLPFNPWMLMSYLLLGIYAYIVANRIINRVLVLVTIVAIIDGIYFFYIIKKIELRLETALEVQKDEMFKLRITLKNRSILPSLFIVLKPDIGVRTTLQSTYAIGTVLKGKEESIYEFEYQANLCGIEALKIAQFQCSSIFSFFKKNIHTFDEAKINILPNVRSISNIYHFTEYVRDFVSYDREKTYKSHIAVDEGEVGYELRPYIEGDSQRLIHWKLATYKDELLVRKREDGSGRRDCLLFILNPFLIIDQETIINQDKLLTSFVSLVGHYLGQGEKVQIAYYQSKKWQYAKVKNQKDLEHLKRRLSDYEVLDGQQVQDEVIKDMLKMMKEKTETKVFVSGCYLEQVEAYLESQKKNDLMAYVWTGGAMIKALRNTSISIWHMTDYYELHVHLGSVRMTSSKGGKCEKAKNIEE